MADRYSTSAPRDEAATRAIAISCPLRPSSSSPGKKYPKAKHSFSLKDSPFMAIAGIWREGSDNHPPAFRDADTITIDTLWCSAAKIGLPKSA
jgi:hypothetical protein